jgi:hypothetical protein
MGADVAAGERYMVLCAVVGFGCPASACIAVEGPGSDRTPG